MPIILLDKLRHEQRTILTIKIKKKHIRWQFKMKHFFPASFSQTVYCQTVGEFSEKYNLRERERGSFEILNKEKRLTAMYFCFLKKHSPILLQTSEPSSGRFEILLYLFSAPSISFLDWWI